MTDKSTTSREALVKIASLVRPAIATQTFIPAYNHIAFDGATALAHNDIAAISVKAKLPVSCCIPGELLIKTLASFGGSEVLLQKSKDKSIQVVSGRSRITLPTMELKDFPFTMDAFEHVDAEIKLTDDMIKGIERCLISAGTNPNHPAQLGVTLDVDGKHAVLFSTDNATISRYRTVTEIKLPGDAPIILPTFFCNQLIVLSKTFSDVNRTLLLMADGLACEFGSEATLFTKTVVAGVEPIDFPRIISKHLSKGMQLEPIPAAFDSSFNRALLVQGSELDKIAEVEFERGTVTLRSSSQMGETHDTFDFEPEGAETGAMTFKVDPTLVVRGAKGCGLMHLGKRVLVLGTEQGKFMHLISHLN